MNADMGTSSRTPRKACLEVNKLCHSCVDKFQRLRFLHQPRSNHVVSELFFLANSHLALIETPKAVSE